MPSATTLHDVAALAGVSPRTVSRVVNDEGGFGAATKTRVLEAIDQLGYRPNLLARALITRRSATIGLVGVELSDPFFAELADEVQRVARQRGRTLFFASNHGDPRHQTEVLETLRSHAAEGVILFPAEGSRAVAANIAANGLPMVLVDNDFDAPWVASVSSEIAAGAEMAVDHLIERGRRCIAMAANVNSIAADVPARREHGYRRALQRAGLTPRPELIVHGLPTIEGGRADVVELLRRVPEIDAVFAYNDMVAIGVMQALARAGRRVPHDVAVVGFNDTSICAGLMPSLTSVHIDRDRLAVAAVELLLQIARHPQQHHQRVALPVSLTVRDSS